MLSISYLPLLTQIDFDALLWACDLNFVRGEDSIVRALWAGKPFVWQLYPQDDGAHRAKLDAFLGVIEAPPSLRAFHQAWNGDHAAAPHEGSAKRRSAGELPRQVLASWQPAALAARQRLSAQDDLCSQLLGFVQKKAKIAGFAEHNALRRITSV